MTTVSTGEFNIYNYILNNTQETVLKTGNIEIWKGNKAVYIGTYILYIDIIQYNIYIFEYVSL